MLLPLKREQINIKTIQYFHYFSNKNHNERRLVTVSFQFSSNKILYDIFQATQAKNKWKTKQC
jgi:hypothetical protein